MIGLTLPGSIFGDHRHTISPRGSDLPRPDAFLAIMAVSGCVIHPRESFLHPPAPVFSDHGCFWPRHIHPMIGLTPPGSIFADHGCVWIHLIQPIIGLTPPGSIFADHGHTQYPQGSALHCSYHFFAIMATPYTPEDHSSISLKPISFSARTSSSMPTTPRPFTAFRPE